ncbi:MAG: flagellar hook-associated protein FlgK, partial [Planctomycetaceae bacterium]|nr:flagellar hook-associated protein FlgK [Planctomycetaceae bacterium]
MLRSFEIGLSAIRTHQRALNVIGNNIANASTPGYHRQEVHLVPRRPELDGGHYVGTGVEVAEVERVIDQATEDSILSNNALLSTAAARLSVAQDIESLLTPSDSSIHAYVSDFFNNLEAVANTPEVTTVRRELLTAAENVVYQFDTIDAGLQEQRQSRISEISDAVDNINRLVRDIADLNKKIRIGRALNQEPNDLLDKRDQLLNELTEVADVSVQTADNGREIVLLGNGALTISEDPAGLEVGYDDFGNVAVYATGPTRHQLNFTSGQLGGLLTAVNETIPEAQARLAQLAGEIVRAVDQVHATGLTETGGYNIIRGTRGVDSLTRSLISTGTTFPVNSGDVTVTVTDPATGQRTSHRVSINPYFDSITDIAARFDAIDGITASVAADTGRLTLSGDQLLQIDFAGRVDNIPDLSSYSGTGTPEFSGSYAGSTNDEWTVSFSGAGTIGVTNGLTAIVTNSAGQVVAQLEVGAGYAAGQPLAIADGVSVSFDNGTVAATDSTSVLVTANSDTSGLLAALGLNSLFEGTNIRSYQVRDDIQNDYSLLALSRTGFPGDAANFARIADLRDSRFDS